MADISQEDLKHVQGKQFQVAHSYHKMELIWVTIYRSKNFQLKLILFTLIPMYKEQNDTKDSNQLPFDLVFEKIMYGSL